MENIESLELFTSFVPYLNKEDARIVAQYIILRGKIGSNVQRVQRGCLFPFFRFVQKANICDIDETDLENYFSHLDMSGIKYSSKKMVRSNLNSFFNYYKRKIQRKNPTFYNPIPPLDECHFTPDVVLSLQEISQKEEDQIFTIKQLKTILKEFHFHSRRHFFVTLLLIFCGMRVSEAISIRIQNVNIEGRYLMTGIEENCRKSNQKGDKPLYFCFPQEVANLLQDYILELKARNPNAIWLFPGRTIHMKINSFMGYLEHRNMSFPIKSHSFRRTLETFQLNLTNRVPLHFVELLSNHVISSVVMKHYNKITLADRRKLYDEYLPQEYQGILAFLHTL